MRGFVLRFDVLGLLGAMFVCRRGPHKIRLLLVLWDFSGARLVLGIARAGMLYANVVSCCPNLAGNEWQGRARYCTCTLRFSRIAEASVFLLSGVTLCTWLHRASLTCVLLQGPQFLWLGAGVRQLSAVFCVRWCLFRTVFCAVNGGHDNEHCE
jgi:hypothetical protein